jgi:hypothetical protein
MRLITSPNAFKSSYIAEIKEELGLLRRKRKITRKIKAPDYIKPFIKEAISNLGNGATYKQIQKEALRLYNEHTSGRVLKYYGILKISDKSFAKSMIEDKGIYYGYED